MIFDTPTLSTNEVIAQSILNWLLPILGVIASLFVILFIWRYLRHSNNIGRISEFNERTFKKLIEDEGLPEQHPFCNKCKIPMRIEVKYKDFLQDQGEFLIERISLEETLQNLIANERISKKDGEKIKTFFKNNHTLSGQLFKRYKCSHCDKIVIQPYSSSKKTSK